LPILRPCATSPSLQVCMAMMMMMMMAIERVRRTVP
jgi:hypothetical protein